jgi:hypothetical protein
MKKTAFMILVGSTLIHAALAQRGITKANNPQDYYFAHKFKTGEKFGTIFSRTIAVTGDDFQSFVFRISGTGNYSVTSMKENQPDFDAVFLYDGRPEDRSKTGIRDSGKTLLYNGKSSVNTDASGLTFNPLLWGTPPVKLKTGDSWEVSIDQPWELGGTGRQRVEVIDVDPVTHLIRLKREGDGQGAFADDQPEMEIVSKGQRLRVKVTFGKNHWVGYTTFKNGIVISDELVVTRPLTLTHDAQQFAASQRQYILLNQMAE